MTDAILVDTSALYAVLDRDDDHHAVAATAWARLLDDVAARRRGCMTHSAVVVETSALVQRRLGLEALRALYTASSRSSTWSGSTRPSTPER